MATSYVGSRSAEGVAKTNPGPRIDDYEVPPIVPLRLYPIDPWPAAVFSHTASDAIHDITWMLTYAKDEITDNADALNVWRVASRTPQDDSRKGARP